MVASGGAAKGKHAMGLLTVISMGSLRLLCQKRCHVETDLCLSMLCKIWLFNNYLLSTCPVPCSVLDTLHKLSWDLQSPYVWCSYFGWLRCVLPRDNCFEMSQHFSSFIDLLVNYPSVKCNSKCKIIWNQYSMAKRGHTGHSLPPGCWLSCW